MSAAISSNSIDLKSSAYYSNLESVRPKKNKGNGMQAQEEDNGGPRVADFQSMRPSEFRNWAAFQTKTGALTEEDIPWATMAVSTDADGQEVNTPRNYLQETQLGLEAAIAQNDTQAEETLSRFWNLLQSHQGETYGLSATA
jgi:hypothetical protein